MKKIRWSILSDTEIEADANRVSIKEEKVKNSDLEVRVIDEKGDKVSRFMDIKANEQKVLLTPKFQWETDDYQDTNENNIEYAIKKADDCWKIDKEERKIMVKPGKKDKFNEALKEMHKNLLKDKFGSTKIGKRLNADGNDMQYTIMDDGSGRYKVKIYRGDSSEDREFLWEQVKIEPNYWQNKGVDFNTLINVEYQEEKKSPWTAGRIIFLVVLATILILIIFFWKKIWKWIKGEREQEKKVKEQLDIF